LEIEDADDVWRYKEIEEGFGEGNDDEGSPGDSWRKRWDKFVMVVAQGSMGIVGILSSV